MKRLFKGEAYRPYRLRYSTQMTQILRRYLRIRFYFLNLANILSNLRRLRAKKNIFLNRLV
ncbi:MAG: hypothetical protein LBJ00_12290 [Planctomycetaceae bacterium]|nr:hypothetical protein [Planctomycetaceae bacterium]